MNATDYCGKLSQLKSSKEKTGFNWLKLTLNKVI